MRGYLDLDIEDRPTLVTSPVMRAPPGPEKEVALSDTWQGLFLLQPKEWHAVYLDNTLSRDSIRSPALFVALSMAVIRAACSAAEDSSMAWKTSTST